MSDYNGTRNLVHGCPTCVILTILYCIHSFNDVRGMLSVLKYESIDKVWKSVLEGTLFEARTGSYHVCGMLRKLIDIFYYYQTRKHRYFSEAVQVPHEPRILVWTHIL